MALKLGQPDTRIIPIEAKEPLNGGGNKPHKFSAEFKVIPSKRWAESLKDSEQLVVDVLDDGLITVNDIKDESDTLITFTEDVKAAVLNTPWLVNALWQAFLAVQNGQTDEQYRKACAKNS